MTIIIKVIKKIIPNIIDEIPILSIASCFADGQTVIRNASELRVKESDRLKAISDGLRQLKIKHDIFDDGISITGSSNEIVGAPLDGQVVVGFSGLQTVP